LGKSFEIALDQKAAMRHRLAAKSPVGTSLVNDFIRCMKSHGGGTAALVPPYDFILC